MAEYHDVVRNTGSKKKAIVAVARKLSVRSWHFAEFHERYEPGLVEEQVVAG